MKSRNLLAKDILNNYMILAHQLTNTYCQLKEKCPFKEFLEIAQAIWRTQALIDGWQAIVDNQLKYYSYEDEEYED